jgi:hypothetical protein
MKLVSLVALAVVALTGFASTSTDAWAITSTTATQPDEVVGKHQEFVKVWTVKGSSPVDAIQLAAAGSVFIDYDGSLNTPPTTTKAPITETPTTTASGVPHPGSSAGSLTGAVVSLTAVENDDHPVMAQILLRGNCTRLLDEIDVVEHAGAIKIGFKNTDFRGFGYLLTEVVVTEKAALAKISSSGSSSAYIGENVVVSNSNKSAAISITGSADVFVADNATAFALDSLALKMTGTGKIQLEVASLSVSGTLSSKISGDGTIAVVAQSINVQDTIETKLSGQGSVYIQAGHVTANHIDTKISGQGKITLSTSGTCVSQDISISGQGNVAAGSILCEDTTLKLTGPGWVLVQTSGTFSVPHVILGNVQYWGVTPQHITDGREPRTPCSHRMRRPHPPHPPRKHHGWSWGWWNDDSDSDEDSDEDSGENGDEDFGCPHEGDSQHFLPQSVTAATENAYPTYAVRAIPARAATFLILTIRNSHHRPEPSIDIDISLTGWDFDNIDSVDNSDLGGFYLAARRVHEQHGAAGTAALGVVAVAAVVTVGVAAHKLVMQQRRRREYQPLLQVGTN